MKTQETFISFAPCRVGQHAVLLWLMKHLSKQGRVGFYNNITYRSFANGRGAILKGSTYQAFEGGEEIVPYKEPNSGPLDLKVRPDEKFRFFSFEEKHFENAVRDFNVPNLMQGRVRYMTILRDPYNWAASYIKFPIRSEFDQSSELWRKIARETLGYTSSLPDNSIHINFNRWKDDPDYRRELANEVGITEASDDGVDVIAPAGRGSSFEGFDPKMSAKRLKLDSRWLLFRHHPNWKSFISEEVNELSRQIFGFDLQHLEIQEGVSPTPGPYHEIAWKNDEGLNKQNVAGKCREFAAWLRTSKLGDYEHHTRIGVTPDMKVVENYEHVFEERFTGRGIVLCAGGGKYMPPAWVLVHRIRELGCDLPIQIWHKDYGYGSEAPPHYQKVFQDKFDDLVFINASEVLTQVPYRKLAGWEMKPYVIAQSHFREIIYMDVDNNPLVDVSTLFDRPAYAATGALFWPDYGNMRDKAGSSRWKDIHHWLNAKWDIGATEQESGQLVIDKERCWQALQFCLWMNGHSDFWYKQVHGDKDTFHLAWRVMKKSFQMHPALANLSGVVMQQHDMDGTPLFQHRNMVKWKLNGENRRVKGFEAHDRAEELLREFKAKVLEGGELIR